MAAFFRNNHRKVWEKKIYVQKPTFLNLILRTAASLPGKATLSYNNRVMESNLLKGVIYVFNYCCGNSYYCWGCVVVD